MTANCYTCVHRRNVPGDAHSRCAHPKVDSGSGDMFDGIIGMVEMMMGNRPASNPLNVRGNPHGIRAGWFMHPFNYDPAWLEACDGHTEKKENG